MTTDQMRVELIKHYKASPSWSRRVKAMSSAQIQAIYLRLKNKGVLK